MLPLREIANFSRILLFLQHHSNSQAAIYVHSLLKFLFKIKKNILLVRPCICFKKEMRFPPEIWAYFLFGSVRRPSARTPMQCESRLTVCVSDVLSRKGSSYLAHSGAWRFKNLKTCPIDGIHGQRVWPGKWGKRREGHDRITQRHVAERQSFYVRTGINVV